MYGIFTVNGLFTVVPGGLNPRTAPEAPEGVSWLFVKATAVGSLKAPSGNVISTPATLKVPPDAPTTTSIFTGPE